MIDIVIPTYGRPSKLEAVADNVYANTVNEFRLVFAVEMDDAATIAELSVIDEEYVINRNSRNYAGAMNSAYRETSNQWIFAGADDLNFHDGWDEEALKMDDGWVGVIGTNDLLNPYVLRGMHATHYLVRRSYLDAVGGVADEGPGSFLAEHYTHQFTDTEFIGTAKMRSKFRPCFTSVVEHLHWTVGKSEHDATSEKAFANMDADDALYEARKRYWCSLSR